MKVRVKSFERIKNEPLIYLRNDKTSYIFTSLEQRELDNAYDVWMSAYRTFGKIGEIESQIRWFELMLNHDNVTFRNTEFRQGIFKLMIEEIV